MILRIKSNFYQIYKLIFLLLLTSISNLYAHNLFNGGCKNHCKESVKPLIINKELNKSSYKNQIEDNDSCLSKSLCRG